MIDHVFFERRLMAAESFAGELRDAGVRADIGPVDGYPGLVVTQSDGTRLLFTISELGATPAAVLAVLAVALLIALATAAHGTPGIAAIQLVIVGAGLTATATTRSTT